MKNLQTFNEFINETLISANKSEYLKSVIDFVKEFYKPKNDKEFTQYIIDALKTRRKQNIGRIADIYKDLANEIEDDFNSKEFLKLNESLNESKTYKNGDIIFIKKQYCDSKEEETMEYEVIEDRDTRVLIRPKNWPGRLAPTQNIEKYMIK